MTIGAAKAADLYIRKSPPPPVYSAPVVVGSVAAGPCPEDILCLVRRYPGWHDASYYGGGCRSVLVREARADGAVFVRRAWVC